MSVRRSSFFSKPASNLITMTRCFELSDVWASQTTTEAETKVPSVVAEKVSAKVGAMVSPATSTSTEQSAPTAPVSTDLMHKMILAAVQKNHAESLRCMYLMSIVACVMFALLFRKLEQQEYRLHYLSKYS